MSTHVIRDKAIGLFYVSARYRNLMDDDIHGALRFDWRTAGRIAREMNADSYDKYVAVVDPSRIRIVRGKGQRRNRRRS